MDLSLSKNTGTDFFLGYFSKLVKRILSNNSHVSLQGLNMLLFTPHLSSYIVQFKHFTWTKTFILKGFPFIEVVHTDFPFSLPNFLTCRSISLLVNMGKVDNDLPHVSALSKWVSKGNDSFIFCNRRLDMIFDEICTAHSPVCLYLIASGLAFLNGKRLHHRSRESCNSFRRVYLNCI